MQQSNYAPTKRGHPQKRDNKSNGGAHWKKR
jgi:hypothetical protein